MNSSTALVPPFFTPTMIAFGNFLFPNFRLLMGGLGVSFLTMWGVEGGLWSALSRGASTPLGGKTHDRDFWTRLLEAPSAGARWQLGVGSPDFCMMVSAGKSAL